MTLNELLRDLKLANVKDGDKNIRLCNRLRPDDGRPLLVEVNVDDETGDIILFGSITGN